MRKSSIGSTLLALGIVGCTAPASEIRYFPIDPVVVEAAKARGALVPFSSAVRVGNMVYLSGAIGTQADGTLPQGIEAQARQTMDNIGAALAKAGLGFNDVIRCTVMLDDMADWPAFNRVYAGYFNAGRLPARSAFGADGLALGALVEVECQAFASTSR